MKYVIIALALALVSGCDNGAADLEFQVAGLEADKAALQDELDHVRFELEEAEKDAWPKSMYVDAGKVEVSELECVYIARFNVGGSISPLGGWDGVSYDGGIAPVFGRFTMIGGKTMVGLLTEEAQWKEEMPEGSYRILWFPDTALGTSWRDTAWGDTMGSYDLSPWVEGACKGFCVPDNG